METQKFPGLTDQQPERTAHQPLRVVGAVIGALVAAGVLAVLSPGFFLVLICLLVVIGMFALPLGWVAWKLVAPAYRPIVPAFAVQAGHTLFQILVIPFLLVLFEAGAIGGVFMLLEALFFAAALVWLIVRPGLAPVVVLTVAQTLEFLLLSSLGLGVGNYGLTINLLLRATGVVLMWVGLQQIRARTAVPTFAPEQVSSFATGDTQPLYGETAPIDSRERTKV
jgi:hypothetical protein